MVGSTCMSDPVKLALIAAMPAVISSYFAYRAAKVSKATHEAVNSRMDKFLKMAEEAFQAKGKLEGVKEEKERTEIKVNQ